jgi:hypothetical protein
VRIAAAGGRDLWRGVEAQHRAATMRLVDDLHEQQLLEQILEESKPPLAPGSAGRHYLLATPFRYTSPYPSRFRRPGEPGVWYGCDEPQTVCAELAYWRWKFLTDSEGLQGAALVTEHTFFQARFKGLELDLTAAPMNALRGSWRDGSDYAACHRLADTVRSAVPPIAAIRYESARREHSGCAAVFTPAALSLAAAYRQQTWTCKTTARLVLFTHDADAFQFDAASWTAA